MNTIVYNYPIDPNTKGSLYINTTNRCTNSCTFCIRSNADGVGGADLWLDYEPSVEEIISAIGGADMSMYNEIVFCGYGEPFMRFYDIMEVCKWAKETYPSIAVRINTNGHANAIAGKDVTPDMRGLVDTVSISLNASTAEGYEAVCKCDYGEDGFGIMLDFAKKATAHVPQVVLSVVDILPKDEIEECRRIAKKAGCSFRVRKMEG